MKTRKECKFKFCTKCSAKHNKKELGVWAVKFPFWICRVCGLKADEAFKKLEKGKFKDGISDLMAVNFGISNTESKSKINKTRKRLKNAQSRDQAYKAMRKKGMSDSEIRDGCAKAGFPDITGRR